MSKTPEELETRLQAAQTEQARTDALSDLAWRIKGLDSQRGLVLSEEAVAWAREHKDMRRLGSGLCALGACLCRLERVDEALPVLEEGLVCSRRTSQTGGEARAEYGLGMGHCMRSEMDLAREHYGRAAEIFEARGEIWDLADCYNQLACIYRDIDQYSQAFSYCDRARYLREQTGDLVGLGATLGNLGNLYSELGDHVHAAEFHQRCLSVFEKTEYRLGICRALGALGGDYCELEQYERALPIMRQSLAMAVELETIGDEITSLLNMGHAFMHLERLDEAEQVYRVGLQLTRSCNYVKIKTSALCNFGKLLYRQGKLDDARFHLLECIAQSQTINTLLYPSIAHQILADIFQAKGDFETALGHHRQYHTLHEKVFTEDADKRSKLLLIQMEVEKAQQEAEIHRLKTVELAEANARLQALATTDPLTGLANHRAMVAALDLELERCLRYTHSCALLFLDIDHFKTLNDSYGHPVGDSVLREFAGLVQTCLRGPDTLGRWGGEEFIALLPETEQDGAYLLAERVRETVAARVFDAAGGLHVTVSIGVAHSSARGMDRDALVEDADRAVYAAKHLGRNQVRLASDDAVALLAAGDQGREGAALTGTVQALAALVSVRDSYTGEHNENVAALTTRLAEALGLDAAGAYQIGLAARLHDIGKVAVPDVVLHKKARLTPRDWELVRQHPGIGAGVVSHVPGLRPLAPLIRSHHERWDGGGYPDGLRGEAIPFGARILAVADAWGAMTTDRPYRAAQSEEWAKNELVRGMGTQFDPRVVQAFLCMNDLHSLNNGAFGT